MNSPKRFPIARFFWRFARRAAANWRERHQNRFNFSIHMIGIPVALLGILGFAFFPWSWALGAVGVGYFLQWVGHFVEGNDVGELIPIKRLFGLPVVAVVPKKST